MREENESRPRAQILNVKMRVKMVAKKAVCFLFDSLCITLLLTLFEHFIVSKELFVIDL